MEETKENPFTVQGSGAAQKRHRYSNSAEHQRQRLSPREQRCLSALRKHPGGLKSYDLRVLTCCAYVPDVIQRLIAKGYHITCTMELDGLTVDGKPYYIGRYILAVGEKI